MDAAHTALQATLNLFDDPQSVRDRASFIFKLVLELTPSHNQTHNAIAAACVFQAQRDHIYAVWYDEIAHITGVQVEKIRASMLVVSQTLGLWHQQIRKPEYIEKLCTPLHLPETVLAAATETYMKVIKLNYFTDADVRATAAACAFKASQASKSPKTMLEIGEAVSVSEGDMLEAYEKLLILPNYM